MHCRSWKINQHVKIKFWKSLNHTDLSTLGIGGQKVDHLDSCDQNLLFHTHVCKLWGLSMDGSSPKDKTL